MKKATKKYLVQQMGKIPPEHILLDRYSPKLLDGILGLRRTVIPSLSKNSAIPLKYKELIVVAIEVAVGRGERGVSHSRRAIIAGASLQELIETLGLCIYLTGMTTFVDSGMECLQAAEKEFLKLRSRVRSSRKKSLLSEL